MKNRKKKAITMTNDGFAFTGAIPVYVVGHFPPGAYKVIQLDENRWVVEVGGVDREGSPSGVLDLPPLDEWYKYEEGSE